MTRILTAVAPIRVADLGGWTDTWFAGHGLVCSIAVDPGAKVRVEASPAAGRGTVVIDATDYGDRYDLREGRGRHPLLEACVDEVGVPSGLDVTVSVSSEIPPGASTGTSAAVAVALVGALLALRGEAVEPEQVAHRAHRIEAVRLGRQSGIQDQRSAAFGGINRIEMRSYPDDVRVRPIALTEEVREELAARLVLVFLGRTHVSSAVHDQVIAGLEQATPAEAAARLDPLRAAAEAGARALDAGDLVGYGRAWIDNTEAQAALHPSLVSADATSAIDAARAAGAAGWKVNGAGGDGGSLALLAGPGEGGRARMIEAVVAADPSFRILPVTLASTGLRVRTFG